MAGEEIGIFAVLAGGSQRGIYHTRGFFLSVPLQTTATTATKTGGDASVGVIPGLGAPLRRPDAPLDCAVEERPRG